ncbi:MAG: hypothetical protein H6509_06285 [Bryobacterales bacterium]|nr:hypothetical protein [Acidobacteriota bacterium]MCB9384204.1 hypothetical protein [Bryobacterales bacterium]
MTEGPYGYFLTFTCYGTRLHGDSRGSVDRKHNLVGARYLEEDPLRSATERGLMTADVASLDEPERAIVLEEIISSCSRQNWLLHAAHVRSTHVHVVLTTATKPEVVLGKVKSFASRALNKRFGKKQRRWATHGSTVWLWDPRRLDRAVDYVVRGQGSPMQLYVNKLAWEEYMDHEE